MLVSVSEYCSIKEKTAWLYRIILISQRTQSRCLFSLTISCQAKTPSFAMIKYRLLIFERLEAVNVFFSFLLNLVNYWQIHNKSIIQTGAISFTVSHFINNRPSNTKFISHIHSFPPQQLWGSLARAALMPDTTADTPDTFSGTVLFPVTKTTQYAARLLLWQWKQWLNRGTDWNNLSVCPLVSQTSCLTKTKSLLMLGFPPCFSLTHFHLFVLSFCLSGWARVHSSGHWVLAQSTLSFFFFVLHVADSNVNSHCEEEEEEESDGKRLRRRREGHRGVHGNQN